jgi:hypothetical protein
MGQFKSTQIATEIMLGMVRAIEAHDAEKFQELVTDPRIGNCIVGDYELTRHYNFLCLRGLRVFSNED